MEVIELATREAGKKGYSSICEIVIEVGDLSGVEAESFRWGLEMLAKDSILEHAEIQIIRIPGNGICSICNNEFIMQNRIDMCPDCHCLPSEIKGGQEFRLVSLVAE